MVTQMKHLFFFHIMQHTSSMRHVLGIMHEPWHSLQFCMDFNHLEWSWSPTTNVCTSLFTSIQVWPSCSSHLFPFSAVQHSHKTPVASSSIDVWQQHITNSILRFHFKNLFHNTFCHLHITMNSASTEQSHPCSHIWFTGHSMTVFSASCRLLAQSRRSTMQE